MLFLNKPRYYDTPEGQAPFEKIVACAKKAIVAGVFIGGLDCVWHTDAKNFGEVVNCMSYWVVPMVGMASTWASVTYISTKVRGKDDWVNYVVGAAACAPIIHAWKKTHSYTIWGTTIAMIAARAAKDKADNGWEIAPEVRHNYGLYLTDFSLTEPGDKDFRSPYKFGL
ncbi:uncharacterized protein ND-B14.7 [Venturia canescens]|uniref:uncharacterized protein ND-B14.7 n=1 Tax=Venturia canescens TaxID=32260 RepID=UPI001C9D4923|nr:uncharacterized protein LOC122413568 [Venturia canescens]XP_043279940.1 uncharacterized protein LOC122413568 [Venturia canescens]